MQINQANGLINRSCGAHRLAPKLSQHILQGQSD
jgi:hypothetical protein